VPTQRLYFIGDRLGFIGRFFIRNNHIGTGARQRQRDSATQSTAGAGNQRLLPVKSICMMTSLREW
jgi:hypothetical protein